MALPDETRAIRDRTLADLIAAHDYYADTVVAWDFVNIGIARGETLLSTNQVTGTTTTEADLLKKSHG